MTDLPHIASRLLGTPLLVARPRLEAILGVLGPRLAGQPLEPAKVAPMPAIEITPEGIAVVPVTGTLLSRSGYLSAASGLMSYGDIGDTIAEAAADPTVRGIVLDVDSPGGEVGGLFDLADRIATLRREFGKPIQAVANEGTLSAAYAIAAATDRITVTQTGEVGSIGVVAVHVDESGADRQAGLAWTFVHAGAHKVDGNPHQPLSSTARAHIQADVDAIHGRFVALVAERRNLAPDAVRATEAAVYRGKAAVSVGLADHVGTLRWTINHMASALVSPPRGLAAHSLTMAKEAPMLTDQEHQPITEDENTAPEAVEPTEPDPNVADCLRAEYAELAAIAAQAHRLGVVIDAAKAMAEGTGPDALRRSVLEQLAARSDAADLVAVAPASGAASESPIVRRARQAAAKS